MHQPLIAMPNGNSVKLVNRTSTSYLIGSLQMYDLIKSTDVNERMPQWLARAIEQKWGLNVRDEIFANVIYVREPSDYAYGMASWELNLLCNYNCEHCYLGERPNSSISMDARLRILDTMQELGVLRLQLTGGEPIIDRYFVETYRQAYDRGMVLTISTNGSWLGKDAILQLLTTYRPLRVVISLYGASAGTYESLTRTPRGTFDRFLVGVQSLANAGVNVRINSIVTKHNEHEVAQMSKLASEISGDCYVYDKMSATIHGESGPLEVQATNTTDKVSNKAIFAGCGAGTQSFHVDPLGKASMCKLGRDPYVQLDTKGVHGMELLALSSQLKLVRSGDCTGCAIQSSCKSCPIIVHNYRAANADKSFYCQ